MVALLYNVFLLIIWDIKLERLLFDVYYYIYNCRCGNLAYWHNTIISVNLIYYILVEFNV